MPRFGPLLSAMATPFRADGSLDLDGAQRLAAHLVDHGSDGVLVAGTTGESPTVTSAEQRELFRAVLEAVGDRAQVIAGVGTNATASTLERARAAEQLGVHGLLAVAPYYNKPSQAGLVAHFSAVATAVDLPIMLYNIPGRTAVEIEPATLLDLAGRHPNIVGVKDSVGDMVKASWLIARMPEHFAVWSGDDKNALPLLAVGGYGLVSVAAHVVGDQLASLLSLFPKDPAAAREIHLRLLPVFTALFVEPNPAPLKAALHMVGLPAGPVRPPLVDAGPGAVRALREALTAAGVTEVINT